jgi:hypothetical protein
MVLQFGYRAETRVDGVVEMGADGIVAWWLCFPRGWCPGGGLPSLLGLEAVLEQ